MSKLREAYTWAEYKRPGFAFVSVALKFVRAVIWLPLLYSLFPTHASVWQWIGFWAYFIVAIFVWLIDSILDADGSGS